MSQFEFKLANDSDDQALRERMGRDCMEGSISVSFRREPNYFIGAAVQGESSQVIKCVEKNTQKLVGLGARMTLEVFINGKPKRMGYLSDLRADPQYRGGTLLMRGYRYLKQLHHKDPVPLYYSVILEGNDTALHNITKSRAGLPIYKNIGKIMTPVIHLDFERKKFKVANVKIEKATEESLSQIFDFINKQYSAKQFSPCYTASDMGTKRLLGLKPSDIYVAKQSDEIIGVVAAWDQSSFRQTHIESYSLGMKILKPFYNFAAKISPLKALPKEGDKVPYFYLALTAIKNDNKEIFRALLSTMYSERRQQGWHYFIAGFHEKNPLLSVLNEYRSIKSAGHLFIVYYPDDEAAYNELDGRVPHIEIGAV